MSRHFAMWIQSVKWSRVRRPTLFFFGPTLGPQPQPGDALLVLSAFGMTQRVRHSSVFMVPRGAEQANIGIGVEADEAPPEERPFNGALICEEGVTVRFFSGRARRPLGRVQEAVQIELRGGDRAWGMISIRMGIATVAVVGGGLPSGADLWNRLVRLKPQRSDPIERENLEPLALCAHDPGLTWAQPALHMYPRGEAFLAVVTPPAGLAMPEPALALVDGQWQEASLLFQNAIGITQFQIERIPANDVVCVAPDLRMPIAL